MTAISQRSRERRERRSQARRASQITGMMQPIHRLPIYELVDAERVQLIHDKSMQILEEAGIAFYDAESQQILRQAGVKMIDAMAYFDRYQVMELVSQAPSQFTLLARNPANNIVIGGEAVAFLPVFGPPFVRDLERGRRDATLEDLVNFIKLTQMSPYLHHQGGVIVEPTDLPFHERHMDIVYAHIKYGDKGFMGSGTMGRNAQDTLDMAAILFGAETMRDNAVTFASINVSSPRQLDAKMLGTMKAFARAGQPLMITPFILSGAMGPASIAGTVAQLNAEALAGIAFLQIIKPGLPCIYGSFLAAVDLQSGAPVFGGPESQLALYLSAQMARHYHLPFRSAGMYASSKLEDAQGAYESLMSMLPGIMARVNVVLHAAGWLENGLTAGYEKFVLDCELLGMFHTYLRGVDWSDEGWAIEEIFAVPPGGHHLGTDHTARHFKDAFYRATLFDYAPVQEWQAKGGESAVQRANRRVKQMLRQYEPPPLDPAIDEALLDYMARRKAQIKPEF